jgi:hypothetical protein
MKAKTNGAQVGIGMDILSAMRKTIDAALPLGGPLMAATAMQTTRGTIKAKYSPEEIEQGLTAVIEFTMRMHMMLTK